MRRGQIWDQSLIAGDSEGLPHPQGLPLLFLFQAFPFFGTDIWGTFFGGGISNGLTTEVSLYLSSLLSSRPQVKRWDQTLASNGSHSSPGLSFFICKDTGKE